MKRLDLIFSERELDAIIKTLEKANVPGYTVMKHATGRGPERVVTEDMEFTGLGANAHVIVFCEQELIDKMRDNIRDDLSYYGGVAYISEATPLYIKKEIFIFKNESNLLLYIFYYLNINQLTSQQYIHQKQQRLLA